MCHMRKDCILVLGNILSLYVKSLWQVIFASILASPPLSSSMFLPWFYLGFYIAFHQKKKKAKIFDVEGEEKTEMVPGALEFFLRI